MAATPSSLGTQFSEELSCSICLELFTRPKVLPCQHTFCQGCLQDHAERQGTFQCPNCRQQLDLPQQGVASLPTNNIVANLCNTLRKRKTEKDHANVKCPDHQSKDINLYCDRCQVPVCVECLGENHKGHRTTNLTTAAQEKKPSAEKLIAEARNLMKIYSDVLQGVRNKETSLTELKQQRDEELDTALAQAVQHLKESKASLKSQADQEHAKNVKDLQTQKNEALEKFAEISSACIAAMKGVEKGGVELLHTEASLLTVVGKFRGESVPTPKSVQIAEFQSTDPKTLTLGQFSSCRKQCWLWRMARIMLLLLQASILAIWWMGFFLGRINTFRKFDNSLREEAF
ncbi:tripartite motif-containing protein 3-like [Branchiostoma floridae x Branchiostoma belcheri]